MAKRLFGVLVALGLLLLGLAPTATATFPGKNGRIAFVRSPSLGANNLFTVKPDGTGLTQLTFYSSGQGLVDRCNFQACGPAWSPDGKTIAFAVADSAPTGIYLIAAGGGAPTLVAGTGTGDSDPSFAPDGKTIVYSCARGLCLVPTAGGAVKVIPNTLAEDAGPVFKPNGSEDPGLRDPNRRVIAFNRSLGSGPSTDQVFTIQPNGTHLTQRTNCGPGHDAGTGCVEPDYTPDTTKIFMATDSNCGAGGVGFIAATAVNGFPTVLATTNSGDSNPSVSPDGKKAVMQGGCTTGSPTPGTPLTIVNTNGTGGRTPVTAPTSTTQDRAPAWGPA